MHSQHTQDDITASLLAQLQQIPTLDRSWPIVGHMPLIVATMLSAGKHVANTLHHILLRSGQANLRLRIGKQWLYLVMEPRLIETILHKGANSFPKSSWEKQTLNPLMQGGLILLEGTAWAQHHRLLTPLFRSSALQQLIPISISTVENRVGFWREPVDFCHEMQVVTMDIMIRYLMQLPAGEIEGEPSIDVCARQFRKAEAELEMLTLPFFRWRDTWLKQFGLQTRFDRIMEVLRCVVTQRPLYKTKLRTLDMVE